MRHPTRPMTRQIDRFAEVLSNHDLEAGDPGGNAVKAARAVGLSASTGNAMLQRLRKELGWQSR